ncbi:P27 family phage terminase small subunit, partial [Kitasatospora aureofaciens]|uniref:P27 family phage terminase small subunit n=1 Tax=Kitasatospora aureofaciens TaxID=1894 RepID=UPI001ADF9152
SMSVSGAKPMPHLQAVREGSFRPDRQNEGARFAPVDPVEPAWDDVFPRRTKDVKETRAYAAALWARIVPALVVSTGLTETQRETVTDYVVTATRIWQGERALSLQGLVVQTERGMVKNPWTSILNAYRSHFRSLTGELGLSPSAASRIAAPDTTGDDDDDTFD